MFHLMVVLSEISKVANKRDEDDDESIISIQKQYLNFDCEKFAKAFLSHASRR
jgi:hypothetical protein